MANDLTDPQLAGSVQGISDSAAALVAASKARAAANVKTAELTSGAVASQLNVKLPASSGGVDVPAFSLDFFVRSSPIDVRAALPGNFVTDGSVNYTLYVQKILDYLRDQGGGTMRMPPNIKILVSALKLYSGLEILAPDWSSQFLVVPGGYGMSVNPGSAGSADPATNLRNIRLSGFQLRGQPDAPVFEEHSHLLNLNAVTDMLIERMLVKGFQGDGIYLGSSNFLGLERHNERVVIDRVTIDGVNADNRNGISIIDGTDITISKFKGLNCTRLGQPGTIDIEPDGQSYTRIRRVTIEDAYIKGGRGTGIAYLLPSNTALTEPITELKVNRATVENKDLGLSQLRQAAVGTVQDRNEFNNVTLKNCLKPFIFDNCRGLTLKSLYVEGSSQRAELGYTSGNFDIKFHDLEMVRCGRTETSAMLVRTIDGLVIDQSLFEDCGREDGTGGRAMYFSNGTGKNIALTRTTIRSPNAKTTVPIGIEAATYVLDSATCRESDNTIMAGINDFFTALQRVHGDVNLLDYRNGPWGDGVVDDYAMFLRAITANPGRRIWCPDPPVKYRNATARLSLPAGTVLEGSTRQGTILSHEFNGDMFEMGEGASVANFNLPGNGAAYNGKCFVYSGTAGRQRVSGVKAQGWEDAVQYYSVNAGSQCTNIDSIFSRNAALTGTGRYAVVIEAAPQLSAVPRRFIGIETDGTCGFDFGGCNDTYLTASTVGDLKYTPNSRGVLVTASRILNQAALTMDGHNNVIGDCDVAPQVTIAAGADNCHLGVNSYNSLPIIDLSGNSRNTFAHWTIAYVPVLSAGGAAPALGNGALVGNYSRTGGLTAIDGQLTLGSTTNLGSGALAISLPQKRHSGGVFVGGAWFAQIGSTLYSGFIQIAGGATTFALLRDTSGSLTAASPAAFGPGDFIRWTAIYSN